MFVEPYFIRGWNTKCDQYYYKCEQYYDNKHEAALVLCFLEKSPETDYGLFSLWENHSISLEVFRVREKAFNLKFQHIFRPKTWKSPWQNPFKCNAVQDVVN